MEPHLTRPPVVHINFKGFGLEERENPKSGRVNGRSPREFFVEWVKHDSFQDGGTRKPRYRDERLCFTLFLSCRPGLFQLIPNVFLFFYRPVSIKEME